MEEGTSEKKMSEVGKNRIRKSQNLFHSNKIIMKDTKSFQKHFAKPRIRGKGRIALDSEKTTCSHDGSTAAVVFKMWNHKPLT